jgi:hypothetical protein
MLCGTVVLGKDYSPLYKDETLEPPIKAENFWQTVLLALWSPSLAIWSKFLQNFAFCFIVVEE